MQSFNISCIITRKQKGLRHCKSVTPLLQKLQLTEFLKNSKWYDSGIHIQYYIYVQLQVCTKSLFVLIYTSNKTRLMFVFILWQKNSTGVVQWVCKVEFEDHIQSLIYVMFLIVMCTFVAMKAHGIITNHREGIFIGLVAGFTIPVWNFMISKYFCWTKVHLFWISDTNAF